MWGWSPKSLTSQPCALYSPVALGEEGDEAGRAYDYRKRRKPRKVLATLTGSTQVHKANNWGWGLGSLDGICLSSQTSGLWFIKVRPLAPLPS